MNMDYLSLSMPQVLSSLVLIALAVGISFLNRAGLEKQYLLGTIRSFFQLWAIGYVLLWLFEVKQPILYLLLIEVMIVVGTLTAARRQEYICWKTQAAIWVALHVSAILVGTYIFYAVLRVQPLINPHLFIPLMGMIIGNAANGAALSVHRLRGEIENHKGEVEVALALGATPMKAVEPYSITTMRNALMPSLNTMMMMGVVQLPGIMSGQILSGIIPTEAVLYQIVVLYMMAGSVSLTCYITIKLESKRFFTERWSLNV
ncbi:iron export ABC transporter permease subunit FetB [bacterium]|nr:iron export ABC transporter permease subunit FetB [bacterium]